MSDQRGDGVDDRPTRHLSPSGARHFARHPCWYKRRRTLVEAAEVLVERISGGDRQALVYRCPLSALGEEPHFHLSKGESAPPHIRTINGVIDALGTDAYRVDDHQVRDD